MRFRWVVLVLVALTAAFVYIVVTRNDSPRAPSLSGPRPDTLTVETIGTSVEGRNIEAVSVGDGPSVVLVIGGLHTGDENPAADLAEQLARYFGKHVNEVPAAVRLVVIPRANPDGYANHDRLNADDVDLNRNWPTADWQAEAVHGEDVVSGGTAPLSEPETAALYTYIRTLQPDAVISLHGYGAVVEPNHTGVADQLATAYTKATGYDFLEQWTLYQITGELIDAMDDLAIPAFDVELRDSEKSRFAKNLAGVKATIKALTRTQAG
jgi:protein MpaA